MEPPFWGSWAGPSAGRAPAHRGQPLRLSAALRNLDAGARLDRPMPKASLHRGPLSGGPPSRSQRWSFLGPSWPALGSEHHETEGLEEGQHHTFSVGSQTHHEHPSFHEPLEIGHL